MENVNKTVKYLLIGKVAGELNMTRLATGHDWSDWNHRQSWGIHSLAKRDHFDFCGFKRNSKKKQQQQQKEC